MMTTQTRKHRATEPLPATERPADAGAHRASRAADIAVAGFLGAVLLVLIVMLGAR